MALLSRLVEISACALVLDEEHAGPEEVDAPVAIVELLDVRLVARDAAPAYVEDFEQFVVEALRVLLLVAGILPLLRECRGPGACFIAGKSHRFFAGSRAFLVDVTVVFSASVPGRRGFYSPCLEQDSAVHLAIARPAPRPVGKGIFPNV